MLDFGFKELDQVVLKTTYPIEVNGRSYEPGEVIAAFDRIQIANFDEIKSTVSAHGGHDDRNYIIWDETKGMRLDFYQGIFSKMQFAFLNNANLLTPQENESYIFTNIELLESDEEGNVTTKFIPIDHLFIKDKVTGEKMEYTKINDNLFNISIPYKDLLVEYDYEYKSVINTVTVGHKLVEGYLFLQGKTKIVDDITGTQRTGIIQIPKLKIMSGLSMKLGENGVPVVGHMSAIADPIGYKSSKEVMKIIFLNDDIDADID